MNATIDQKCAEILSEKERLGGMAEPPKEQIRQLGIKHAYLAALKNIFNEPDLLDHFSGVNGVFARILNQVIHGKSYENVDDELHLAARCAVVLTKASNRVFRYESTRPSDSTSTDYW